MLDRRQYGCIAYHKRRTTVCRNAVKLPIATLDAAVLRALTREALRPAVERAIVEGLLAELAPRTVAKDHERRRKELATLDQEIARLTEAIATGGQLTPLIEALSTRTARRTTLAADVDAQATVDVTRLDPRALGKRVRERFAAWRADLDGPLPTQRQLLREILTGPVMLTPQARAYRFEGEVAAERLLTGEIGYLSDRKGPESIGAPGRTRTCDPRLRRVRSCNGGRWVSTGCQDCHADVPRG